MTRNVDLYDYKCEHLYDYECAAQLFGCPAFLPEIIFCPNLRAPPIFSNVPFSWNALVSPTFPDVQLLSKFHCFIPQFLGSRFYVFLFYPQNSLVSPNPQFFPCLDYVFLKRCWSDVSGLLIRFIYFWYGLDVYMDDLKDFLGKCGSDFLGKFGTDFLGKCRIDDL